jgi:tetratricopeptide (TPR) repeat protein
MRRCLLLCGVLLVLAGCGGKKPVPVPEPEPPGPTVNPVPQPQPNPVPTPNPNPTPVPTPEGSAQERYDAALLEAYTQLSQGKYAEALAAFEAAKAINPTDVVQREIERVRAVVDQQNGAAKAIADIRAVLQDGKPEDAARLANQALLLYGSSENAAELAQLKRQADALLTAVKTEDKAATAARLRKEIETALDPTVNNLRAAVAALEQLDAVDDSPEVDKQLADLRGRLTTYDTARQRAQELRADPGRLEDALEQLQAASQAWNTFEVRQQIDEVNRALAQRKPRLAVAEFEVRGLIDAADAGKVVAGELLPAFKGKFDLVEREQLGKVLADLKLEAVDAAANEAARTELARMGRVRYLVVGSVSDLGGLVINARVIDLQSGLIIQTARIVATDLADARRQLPQLGAILQMSDEEKLAFEAKQVQQIPVMKPVEVGVIPPAPQPLPQGQAAPPPVININVAVPAFGKLAVADLDNLPAVPAVAVPLVIPLDQEDAIRARLLYLVVLVGDNHFRRGHFVQALRLYDLAVGLGGPLPELLIRVDRARAFLPLDWAAGLARQRIVVLDFLTVGNLPWGLGSWVADALPYYLPPSYEPVSRGELYWYMNQLGLTIGDVVYNPAARLWLGRLMGVRYFVLGSLRETFSFDVTAHLVDAEFGYQVSHARMHVHNPWELKLRLPELTQRLFLSPAERLRLDSEAEVARLQAKRLEALAEAERLREIRALNNYPLLIIEARRQSAAKNFTISIELFALAQKLRPDSIEVQVYLTQDRELHRQQEIARAWQNTAVAQQNALAEMQRKQNDLTRAVEEARARADREAANLADAERRARDAEREKTQQAILLRARNAYNQKRYDLAISLYQDAVDLRNTQDALQGLAFARAERDKERELAAAQEKARQEELLRKKREQELVQLREQLEIERLKREAQERALREAQAARDKEQFARLLQEAREALGKQHVEGATSALTTARQLRPDQQKEIDPLWNQLIDIQNKLALEKADASRRAELEKLQQAEKEARAKAEAQALQNQGKYQALLLEARKATTDGKHDVAVLKYQEALKLFHTDEVVIGLNKAKETLAQEVSRKAEADRLAAETKKLRVDGLKALEDKDFPRAKALLTEFNKRSPGEVAVLAALSQAEQAISKGADAARREQERKQRDAEFAKLLTAGRASLEAKQYASAVAALREAVRLNPDHRESKELLAEAEKGLSAGPAVDPKKLEQFQKLVGEGRFALGQKQFDKAETAYKEAQKLLPEDKSIAGFLTEVKTARDAETARIKAESARREEEVRKAKLVADSLQTARLLLGKKDLAGAGKAIAEAAKVLPDNPDVKKAQQELATAEAQAKAEADVLKKRQEQHATLLAKAREVVKTKPEEALRILADANDLIPNDPGAKALRTEAEAAIQAKLKGRIDALIADARKAMNATPRDIGKASQLLREARQLGPNDASVTAAIAELDKIAKDPGTNPRKADYDLAMGAGKGAMGQKNYLGAVNSYKEALRLIPGDKEATTRLAEAERLLADTTRDAAVRKALDAGTAALKANKFADAMQYANEALRLQGDNKEAAKLAADIRAAEDQVKKDRFTALLDQGKALLAQKKYTEAVGPLDAAVKLFPTDQQAQTLLKQAKDGPPKPDPMAEFARFMGEGAAHEGQKKYGEAEKAYAEALKIKPTDTTAKVALQRVQNAQAIVNHLTAGNAALAAKKWADAEKAFNDVLKIDSKNADALAGLQKVKDNTTPPPNPMAEYAKHMTEGAALEGQKKYSEAEKAYAEALKVKPNDPSAKSALQRVQTAQTIATHLANGNAALKASKWDDATKAFNEVLKIDSKNADALAGIQKAKDKKTM